MLRSSKNCSVSATIIIPAHNRRDVTLNALRQIDSLGLFGKFHVIVVDDGSTDGTSDAISKEFKDVELLSGNGSLYWTGAMELGMRRAVTLGTPCIVWLNDDIQLFPGSIEAIVSTSVRMSSIISGQGLMRINDESTIPFGLIFKGKGGLIIRDLPRDSGDLIPVDTSRGNLVAIPSDIVKVIGYPDGRRIPHINGDTDYCLRATSEGIRCFTMKSAEFIELEAVRDDRRSWLLSDLPFRKIVQMNFSKRGAFYPRMIVNYNLRHWGIFGIPRIILPFGKLVMIFFIRGLIPRSLLLRFRLRKPTNSKSAFE